MTRDVPGRACINCGRAGGSTRAVSDIAGAPRLVAHLDTNVCLRYIARYITGLHLRLTDVAEHAVAALAKANSPDP